MVSSWWDLSQIFIPEGVRLDFKSSNTDLWVTGLMQHSLGLIFLMAKISWILFSHVRRFNLACLTILHDSSPLESQLHMPSLWPLKNVDSLSSGTSFTIARILCFPTRPYVDVHVVCRSRTAKSWTKDDQRRVSCVRWQTWCPHRLRSSGKVNVSLRLEGPAKTRMSWKV